MKKGPPKRALKFSAPEATESECFPSPSYGPHARTGDTREVVLKIAATAEDPAILQLLSREIFPSATAMAPGITGVAGGRPSPSPLIRGSAVLAPRAAAPVAVHMQGVSHAVSVSDAASLSIAPTAPDDLADARPDVPRAPLDGTLIDLAVARSGDKGDIINIGVSARSAEAFETLLHHLTADRVAEHLHHLGADRV